jgi:hypothetical protein
MRTDQSSKTHAIENRDRMLETFARNRRGRPERSMLSIGEMETAVAEGILDEGLKMKARPNDYRGLLSGISVAGLFQKTSTRTRCSFETGVWRYYDLIVARMNRHEDLAVMKAAGARRARGLHRRRDQRLSLPHRRSCEIRRSHRRGDA